MNTRLKFFLLGIHEMKKAPCLEYTCMDLSLKYGCNMLEQVHVK